MNASDVMTSPVLTAGPDTQVRGIAALLFERRISAVPVVDGGALVGIVSRANLVQALAVTAGSADEPASADDQSIRRSLLEELERQDGWRLDRARQVLAAMGESHRVNIEACSRLLDSMPASRPA